MSTPDEYDAFKEGWNAALDAAFGSCRPVWMDTGLRARAVTDVELVWLRRMTTPRTETD